MIENFKFDDLARYGLSHDYLKGEFPGLIYCSITGFGQTGPNPTKSGYDVLARGYGGIMSIDREPDGDPMKVAVGITDVMTGMYAATEIMAALRSDAGSGAVELIGNPLKMSLTPIIYRCAPPTCGADAHSTIREILGQAALSNARVARAVG